MSQKSSSSTRAEEHPCSLLASFYTLTPLHAGAGAGLGAIDLPLQRERMSGLPQLQGSGIKGAWREQARLQWFNDQDKPTLQALFGSEPPKTGDSAEALQAGALSITDARLLLFPVRSARGGFAWLTCPLVLERLSRDLTLLELAYPPENEGLRALLELQDDRALVGKESRVVAGDRVILEDLDYTATPSAVVDGLAAWLVNNALPEGLQVERLARQLVILSDAEFQQMTELRTEVVTRIRISPETHTVEQGALWTEEQLPAESLLYSAVRISKEWRAPKQEKTADSRSRDTLVQDFLTLAKDRPVFHLGGDRTLGRGLVQVRLMDSPNKLELAQESIPQGGGSAPIPASRQDRIRAAMNAVTNLKSAGEEGKNLCLKLPSLLQNNGLGQTLAFLAAKGKDDASPFGTVLRALVRVLGAHGLVGREHIPGWIAGASAQQVRQASRDALDFAGWLKRFAQAQL